MSEKMKEPRVVDCPECGMALWFGKGEIGKCVSPYCREAGRSVRVAPCGCYTVNTGRGRSQHGCKAHMCRLPISETP